jgi:hypothetical protein
LAAKGLKTNLNQLLDHQVKVSGCGMRVIFLYYYTKSKPGLFGHQTIIIENNQINLLNAGTKG